MLPNVFIIGIAGRSGSGKSTLAKKLLKTIGKDSLHINVDEFLLNSADFNCGAPNLEESSIIQLIYSQLHTLKEGKEVDIPVFECIGKQILDKRFVHYMPARFIIVEGTIVLWDKKIRDLIDLKVFLDVTNDLSLKGRLKRESEEASEAEYEKVKKRVLQRWEIGSKQWDLYLEDECKNADIIIHNSEEGVSKILSSII